MADEQAGRPYGFSPGEGWVHRDGADFIIKAREQRAGAGAAVFELVTKKGEEPPEHVHETEDEMFYQIEGVLTVHCAGEAFTLRPGGFAFLPRGVPHTYTIESDGPVRFLVVTAPQREGSAGWGGLVSELEGRQG